MLVINIHAPIVIPEGRIELLTFSRCAVPFFFIVNGYFLYRSDSEAFDQTIQHRIHKNMLFTGKGLVVYFIINVFAAVATHGFTELVHRMANPLNLFYFLVLNWTTPYFGVGHLWYLFALLYALVLLKYTMRFIKPHLLPISIILLCVTYSLECVNFFTSHQILDLWYRNSLLLALPCIALGYWCAQHKEKLMKSFELGNLVLLFFVAWIFFKFEYRVLGDHFYIYIHSVLFALGALLLALKYPNLFSEKTFLVRIGERYTHDIYMWHYVPLILLIDFQISIKYEFSFAVFVMAIWIALKCGIQKVRSRTRQTVQK